MTCNHGCRRCETEKSWHTIAMMLICAVVVSAVIQWWYVSLPILALLTACYVRDNRGLLKASRS